MLDTLLQIGKTFREAKRLKHHRYIKLAPAPEKDTKFIEIPVLNNFEIQINNLNEIPRTDETKIQSFYYLTYKTSDNDNNSFRYLFGDLCYGLDKNGKENQFYRLNKSLLYTKTKKKDNDFILKSIEDTIIKKFLDSFKKNVDGIENILKTCNANQCIYIHFNFEGKNWYELDDVLDIIDNLLVYGFAENNHNLFSLKKMLYRTISSGDEKNDVQFPEFDKKKKYRSVAFSIEDVKNLFYAINYSEKPLISKKETKSDIKIIVLPKGENLTADILEDFSEKIINEETLNKYGVKIEDFEEILTPFLFNINEVIVEFDVIFCKVDSRVDIDVLEISSIKKSFLQQRLDEINEAKREICKAREKEIKTDLKNISIQKSLFNILGSTKHGEKSYTGEKKYQNHLLKTLPKIYTGTYYQDTILLPAFIEKVEFDVRNNSNPQYNFLKYDYYFLTKIQNSNTDRIMEMKETPSYKAGLSLGRLAKPIGRGKEAKIASFEKSYVGLLSRHIINLNRLIEFSNEIFEKIAIHEVLKEKPYLSSEMYEFRKHLNEIDELKYNKHYCAAGFFEGYFGRYEPETDNSSSEKNTSENNDNLTTKTNN